MELPSREVPYTVPARFATIKAAGGSLAKTTNSNRIRQWQEGVRPGEYYHARGEFHTLTRRPGTLVEDPLPTEKPLPLSPGPEKKNSWKKLVKTLHSCKRYRRNDKIFAIELQSETDRLDTGSDAVSLTFQTARSEITQQEENGSIDRMRLSSLLHSSWEEQSKRSGTITSEHTIEALPSIPPSVWRKERIGQQTDMAMDPASVVLYDFLGFGAK